MFGPTCWCCWVAHVFGGNGGLRSGLPKSRSDGAAPLRLFDKRDAVGVLCFSLSVQPAGFAASFCWLSFHPSQLY